MRKLTVILLVLFPLLSSAAGDGEARRILDRTAAALSGASGVQANFTLSGAKTGSVSGTLAVKGRKYFISTPQTTVWYNGKTQWTYMRQNDEVNVSAPTAAQQSSINPYRFLSLYKTGYALSSVTRGGTHTVTMKAQTGRQPIREAVITIDAKTGRPSQIRILQGGAWLTIRVSGYRAQKLADSMFVFDKRKYPSAEIVDLR